MEWVEEKLIRPLTEQERDQVKIQQSKKPSLKITSYFYVST